MFSVKYELSLYGKCMYLRPKMPFSVAQAGSCYHLRTGLDSRPVHVEFVVNKVTLWHVFLPECRFPLSVSFSFSILMLYEQGRWGKAGTMKQRIAVSDILGGTEYNFHVQSIPRRPAIRIIQSVGTLQPTSCRRLPRAPPPAPTAHSLPLPHVRSTG